MSKQPYRHGDVLLIPVDETPKTTAPVEREGGDLVLAHGESTGHRHVVMDDSAVLSQIMESPDRLLELSRSATLRQLSTNPSEVEGRDLHGPIDLPPGRYVVRIQRQLERRGVYGAVID
jgi:hypothetical protein